MSKYLFFLILLFLSFQSSSQSGAVIDSQLEEIIVTSYREKPGTRSSLMINTLSIDSIRAFSGFNLSHNLLNINGVAMLSTGLGITKPVIRGLYGNRVLVLLNGLRFDNQQWQEEHGLGLSSFGLAKIELIKGPLGILYGSEAMGGVINLIDENKAESGKTETDYSIQFNSNTLGGMLQAGIKKNNGRSWWRIRLGLDNHGDYSNGNGERVLNSRFDGYYIKSTYGFEQKNWQSITNLYSSVNRFGFIFNDIYNFISPDNRWSRVLSDFPSHRVFLNIVSSENTIKIERNKILKINLGIQSNRRQENEGSGAISLDMHLLTFQSMSKYTVSYSENQNLTLSNQNSFEINTNYGARKIIPDASLQESNFSAHHEYRFSPLFTMENGFGLGQKWISTRSTPSVNDQQKEVKPFQKFSMYYNFLSGISYLPSNSFNLKANIATGVRVANLAELSSDGLHEGVFNYEIGNPNLSNEQIFSFNLASNLSKKMWTFSLSPFYNYFLNYIYLTPVAEEWFGFPVYRYVQGNTRQYGLEFTAGYDFGHDLKLKVDASGMKSLDQFGNFTPFTPPVKLNPSIQYKIPVLAMWHILFSTNLVFNFAQNNIAPLEKTTPAYQLWNASLSTKFNQKGKVYNIGFAADNILNAAYYDHLSRLKNYGLLNIGRNLSFSLKVNI